MDRQPKTFTVDDLRNVAEYLARSAERSRVRAVEAAPDNAKHWAAHAIAQRQLEAMRGAISILANIEAAESE